jgi:uncharacterized damage-inducible protein DinB
MANPTRPNDGMAHSSHAAGAVTGVRAELVASMEDAEKKFVALAEATPADKYAYRPAAGVRSAGELFVHVAGGNLMFPGMAGAPKSTMAYARDAEKTVTEKARIVSMLKESFAYAKQAIAQVPDAQLDGQVSMFGRQASKRAVLMLMATHTHEHLGQAIAYARASGIVPPWSQGGTAGDR